MPRIALISDSHGNLDALVAVLRSIDEAGVDHVVSLGDAVGYGPEPGACVELIDRVCDAAVVGNHDEAALLDICPANFTPTAAGSWRATREMLLDSQLDVIAGWDESAEFAGVSLVHASFGSRRSAYVQTPELAADSFAGMPGDIGFFGHTHMPSIMTCPRCATPTPGSIRGPIPLTAGVDIPLPGDRRVLINPGSVGQPRDRNPHAAWGLIDTGARVFRLHRVAYDVDAVERKMRARGLPDFLHQRLRVGA